MKATARDIDTMARTIYGEARSEPLTGQLAVAHVVLNRAKLRTWMGKTIHGVCRKPWQFSCWNKNDPNRAKLLKVDLSSSVFRLAMLAAIKAIDWERADPTEGATHYHTVAKPKWAKSWPPNWVRGATKTKVIGDHVFYRDVP